MSTLSVKPASDGMFPHTSKPCTITSLDLNDLLPTRVIETIPDIQLEDVSGNGALRLMPQSFPPYGKIFIKNASFFVPINQLLVYGEDLISRKSSFKSKAVIMPKISMFDFLVECVSPSSGYSNIPLCTVVGFYDPQDSTSVLPDPNTYDFYYPYVPSGYGHVAFRLYQFTAAGSRVFKILKLLGYDLPNFEYVASDTTAAQCLSRSKYYISALPLLAYLKCYTDMFLSGTFYNSSILVSLLEAVKEGSSVSGLYNSLIGHFDKSFFRLILDEVLVPHSQNMYLEAWNSQFSPDGVNVTTDMQSLNPSNYLSPSKDTTSYIAKQLDTTANSILLYDANSGTQHGLTQQDLMLLKSTFLYIQRNNLAGTKAAQMLYARLGIKTEDYLNNYVHKLTEGSELIDFNAVMNNNGAAGSTLGDYAGFGSSGVNVQYSYEARSYGYVITLHWLQIVPIKVRGCSPAVLRMDGLDFWQPEYDGQANRAIPNMELTGPQIELSGGASDKSVFGYTEIYQEYREQPDAVAGSFLRGAARNYFFGRDYTYLRAGAPAFKPQTLALQSYLNGDNKDITNPFNGYQSNGDRFYLYIDWTIKDRSKVLSNGAASMLEGEGETEITKNGAMMS